MKEAVIGIGGGLLLFGIVLVMAPWWITLVGPWIERWADWTIRQVERIEERRDHGRQP